MTLDDVTAVLLPHIAPLFGGHGAVLVGRAIENLRDAPIKELVLTDSIPLPPQKQLPNAKILSVAPLLAEAIKRIHFNESVSKLFE